MTVEWGAPALKSQLFAIFYPICQLLDGFPEVCILFPTIVSIQSKFSHNPLALLHGLTLHNMGVAQFMILAVNPDRRVIGRHRLRSLAKRNNDYCIHGTHLTRASRINSSLMVLREGIEPLSPI